MMPQKEDMTGQELMIKEEEDAEEEEEEEVDTAPPPVELSEELKRWFESVEKGEEDEVKRHLDQGIDVNSTDQVRIPSSLFFHNFSFLLIIYSTFGLCTIWIQGTKHGILKNMWQFLECPPACVAAVKCIGLHDTCNRREDPVL